MDTETPEFDPLKHLNVHFLSGRSAFWVSHFLSGEQSDLLRKTRGKTAKQRLVRAPK